MRINHRQTVAPGGAAAHAEPAAAQDRVESLGLLIHGLSKGWREELDRRLRPLGLTRVQWQGLLWLSRSGGTLMQHELAALLDIGAPATVALVDRMERDGLVERAPVPGDRRRNAIRITASARKLQKAIDTTALQLRRDVLSGLTRDEVRLLCELLDKAKRRIDEIRS